MKQRFVKEWDFKDYFNQISVTAVNDRLKFFQVPDEVIEWINKVNLSQPKLPEDRKIDESRITENIIHQHKIGDMMESSAEKRHLNNLSTQ
jgi:hypothetical protein